MVLNSLEGLKAMPGGVPGIARYATDRVRHCCVQQRKPAGELLFSEGDEANSVFEVLRGWIRLYKQMPDGRRQITGFLTAGHLIGLAPEGMRVFTAEAITDVVILAYPRAAFDRMIDEVPGFARHLLDVTSHELFAAQDQMLLLGRKSASEKVASFLLTIADALCEAFEADIELPMTRGDMADYLGLTTETVSRTLSLFKSERLISIPSTTRIVIHDRDRLEDHAAGDAGEAD